MSLLNLVTTGRTLGAQVHTIFGDNGIGKTTWAASFPNSIVLDIEKGSENLQNVTRIPANQLTTLESVRAVLKELVETNHAFKTVVIDSVDALERLISDFVCKEGNVNSIEKYDGGYGKGYQRTREVMIEIFDDLRKLQAKGITSILVAHSTQKTITDVGQNQTYDRVVMRCNEKFGAVIRDLSDNVFYATYQVVVDKDKNGKNKAFSDGTRILYCQWRPGFQCKNRLDLPLKINLSYDSFIEACTKAATDTESIIKDIQEITSRIKDEKTVNLVKAAMDKNKTNPSMLNVIKNKAMGYVVA